MSEDPLERLFRVTDPARTPLGPPSPEQMAVARAIMDGPTPRRHIRPRFVIAPLAAFAVVVTVLLAFVNPFASPAAVAYGPPPLEYTPIERTVNQVFGAAQQELADGLDTEEQALRESRMVGWWMSIAEAGTDQQVIEVMPRVADFSWNQDGSGVSSQVVGEPWEGLDVDSVPTEESVPGTVLFTEVYDVGEYVPVVTEANFESADGASAYLELIGSSAAGDAFSMAGALFSEWTLTDQQHGYVLEALRDYDGISVLGKTEDRLGRDVIGIQGVIGRGTHAETLLISTDTGRIVGAETSVIDSDVLGLPTGTVMSYSLWDDIP